MEHFETCKRIFSLINQNNYDKARQETILLLNEYKEAKLGYNELINHLIREVGLYQYIDETTSNWTDRFGLLIIGEVRKLIQSDAGEKHDLHPEWLKSRVVRKLLDMSAGSLQNLRITGKVRFKKVLGSYYYSKADIMGLFNDKEPGYGTT